MERRVLLAIFLAFLVLYAWQALFVKPVPKPAGAPAAAPSPTGIRTPGKTGAQRPSPAAPVSAPNAPPEKSATGSAPAPPAAAPVVADTVEHDVLVETRDVIAVFTNRGARLKSWRLKHYLNPQGQPQELVEREMTPPFTLRTANDALDTTLNGALYTVSGAPPTPSEPAPIDLRFEYSDSAGVHAVKNFHLEPSSYVVTLRESITDGDREISPAIVWGP